MAVGTIVNELVKYFDSLASSSTIVTAFGVSLTDGDNLFMIREPSEATQCITIIPYPGGPPVDNSKYESSVQIRVKAKNYKRSLETSQAIINALNRNDNVCASTSGIIFAEQSTPIFLFPEEGGEFPISVSNYTIKYIKI